MNKQDRVVDLAKQNVARPEIAAQVGLTTRRVYGIIAAARRRGESIPRARGSSVTVCSDPRVVVPANVLAALEAPAAARGIGSRDLAARLLETIAVEAMVDAILDDGDTDD